MNEKRHLLSQLHNLGQGYSVGRESDAANHPTVRRSLPTAKNYSKMSTVPQLRSSVLGRDKSFREEKKKKSEEGDGEYPEAGWRGGSSSGTQCLGRCHLNKPPEEER